MRAEANSQSIDSLCIVFFVYVTTVLVATMKHTFSKKNSNQILSDITECKSGNHNLGVFRSVYVDSLS